MTIKAVMAGGSAYVNLVKAGLTQQAVNQICSHQNIIALKAIVASSSACDNLVEAGLTQQTVNQIRSNLIRTNDE